MTQPVEMCGDPPQGARNHWNKSPRDTGVRRPAQGMGPESSSGSGGHFSPGPARRWPWKRKDKRPKYPPAPPVHLLDQPEYVQACCNNPHGCVRYSVWTWDKANPDERTRSPYACRSWRCAYGCREQEARVLFARAKEAYQTAWQRNRDAYNQRHELEAVLPGLRERVDEVLAELQQVKRELRPSKHRRTILMGLRSDLAGARRALKTAELELARALACPGTVKSGEQKGQPKLWKGLVFVVLTLDPRMHERAQFDMGGVYKDVGPQVEHFMKRLRRWMYSENMLPLGNEWFQTIEAHQSGVPHINLIMYHPEWAALLRTQKRLFEAEGLSEKEAIQLPGALVTAAVECGLGEYSTAEACRRDCADQLLGYVVKTARELARSGMPAKEPEQQREVLALQRAAWKRRFEQASIQPGETEEQAGERHRELTARLEAETARMIGELVKTTQVPLHAPLGFRRYRSGKGFLPPRRKNPRMTGAVLRARRSREGDEEIWPVVRSNNEAYMETVSECCERERELVAMEEERLCRETEQSEEQAQRDSWDMQMAQALQGERNLDKPEVSRHLFGASEAAAPPRIRTPEQARAVIADVSDRYELRRDLEAEAAGVKPGETAERDARAIKMAERLLKTDQGAAAPSVESAEQARDIVARYLYGSTGKPPEPRRGTDAAGRTDSS